MIDQNSFHNLSVNASSRASISIIDHSQPTTGSVGVGMYPSLMGTFSCHEPIEFGTLLYYLYGGSLDSSFTEYFEHSC